MAVDDVSFTVEQGEVLGFLGPNGAGKSTTMRMVTGYLSPSSGEIKVDGHDIVEESQTVKQLIGYLPENAPAYPDMTVLDFLSFAAEMRGLGKTERTKAIDRVIDMCFLDPVRHQSVDTLSKGYRHRVCFAQSIIHDPAILIMDEPTDGLDPNQKHEVRTLIRNMGEKKAIIFSTHILEEVEAVCTRAIIIDRGRIVANGTPEELKQKSELSGAVTLSLEGAPRESTLAELKALPGVKDMLVLNDEDPVLRVRLFGKYGRKHADALSAAVSERATAKHWRLRELRNEEGRLDEVFRSITLPDSEPTREAKKA